MFPDFREARRAAHNCIIASRSGWVPMPVSLREINRESLRAVCRLDAGDAGKNVAPNAISIAQAYFYDEAWFRAIYAEDSLVGFIMLNDPTLCATPEDPRYFLWRLMIDQAHQGKGYGHAAVESLADHVRTRPGGSELWVSHTKGVEALKRFYGSLGFRYNGEEDDGELVMMRPL